MNDPITLGRDLPTEESQTLQDFRQFLNIHRGLFEHSFFADHSAHFLWLSLHGTYFFNSEIE